MRRLAALAILCACGGAPAPPPAAGAKLVLDVPGGMLDPRGYATVEIVLHEDGSDIKRTVAVDASSNFDLDRIDPSTSVEVEATLRTSTGTAVGYGRTAVAAPLASGAQITIPVRRPIAYFAGMSSDPSTTNPSSPLHWTEMPATYSDLSAGTGLDGQSQVGSNVVLIVAAGPNLYMITQAAMDPTGALIGAAKLMPISMTDHSVGAAMPGMVSGAVIDGAGSDDGSALVIGTSTELFAVDTTTGMARVLADGSFSRVAILGSETGELTAVAIKNRGAGTCVTGAELWWAPITGAAAGPAPGSAKMIATAGFSDIATDRGHAYYVDACKGELGEVTAGGAQMLRTLPGVGGAAGSATGKPTMLAVSGGQAYVGVEAPPASATAPATASVLVAPLATGDAPHALWSEGAQQVIQVISVPDVERLLSASAVAFNHLEVGAGGDYVALTTSAHFHGAEIDEAGFPDTTMDIEELRVFAAATGGAVQRYRSWCDGTFITGAGLFGDWRCAAAAGQSTPATAALNHHIASMTFLFGKK
jgi:hypothetical protein